MRKLIPFLFLLAACGAPDDDTLPDAGDEVADAADPADADPSELHATLGRWALALVNCDPATIDFALTVDEKQTGSEVVYVQVTSSSGAINAAGVYLNPFEAEVYIQSPDEIWRITLHDDGTTISAWVDYTGFALVCSSHDYADITAREP